MKEKKRQIRLTLQTIKRHFSSLKLAKPKIRNEFSPKKENQKEKKEKGGTGSDAYMSNKSLSEGWATACLIVGEMEKAGGVGGVTICWRSKMARGGEEVRLSPCLTLVSQ